MKVRGPRLKARKFASTIVLLAVLGGGGYVVYTRYFAETAVKIEYKTATIERGRVTASVTASGTLSPLKTVQVGSQVSGKILELFADFNSEVKKGDLLAKLDPSLLEQDKSRTKANLLSAQASLTRAIADRDNAKSIYERTKSLADSKVVATQEVDVAYVTYKSAKAAVESAQAAVSVARAAIETSDVNLTYTTIVSPIDGIVISRDVSVGQTVAASLSAPTLFTIAEDLRQMEVHTNVAESDVGVLKPDMQVRFTVDAYPNERFRGVVQQIRNAPQTVSNVVTYDAVVRVQNDELKLRPGMTASVTFQVEDRRDVILVPNAALRYTPSDPAIAALAPKLDDGEGKGRRGDGEWRGRRSRDEAKTDEAKPDEAKTAEPAADAKSPDSKSADPKSADSKSADSKSADSKSPGKPADAKSADSKSADSKGVGKPGDAKSADSKSGDSKSPDSKSTDSKSPDATPAEAEPEGRGRRNRGAPSMERTVWVLDNGAPRPVVVTIGISDGTHTEVVAGELKEGDQIITGQSGGETKEAAPAASSPFPGTGNTKGGGGARGGGGGGRRGGF